MAAFNQVTSGGIDIELIIDMLDEAHDVLRDHARRERYRRAIEDKPPA